VVVRDRVSRYEAEAERRAYLAELARGNEETAARLRAGARAVPLSGVSEEDPEGDSEGDPAGGDAPSGNGVSTTGDKADVTRGFSSYSPVGHYVPEVVEEETQRG